MKILKIAAFTLGGIGAVYYLALGSFYFSGYRVYRIPTAAMQPTIQKNELVVGRLSETYRTRVQRFDLAVFTTPQAPGDVYTKRVVGLPGERIVIDATGVKIHGRELSLPGTVSAAGFGLKPCDLLIPNDAVFVLGDNTPNSLDSRFLGPIPKKDLLGYLVFKK